MKTKHFPNIVVTTLTLFVTALWGSSCHKDLDPSQKPKTEALAGTVWIGQIYDSDFEQGEVTLTFYSATSGKLSQKIQNNENPVESSIVISYAYVAATDAYKLTYGEDPDECLWARIDWNAQKLHLCEAGETENTIGKEVVVLMRQK